MSGTAATVQTGLDAFLGESDKFKHRNVALIANQSSVSAGLDYSWMEMRRRGLSVKRIFSPEHGLFAVEQDQVPVGGEALEGMEIVSLYGASYQTLSPPTGAMEGIDLVLFDIQDVGARYYTYVNTMAMFMEAVNGRDIEFMVLDRPNPLGGVRVEGPQLSKGFESFVGVHRVPVRHGLTAGELARHFKSEHGLDVNLSVTEMKGWRRTMLFGETGLPWVPPSPNMPTLDTAFLYPGLCLIEGTNLSEGRGTALPFKTLGAPFVDPFSFAGALEDLALEGVRFRPVYFKPSFQKYAGEVCGGVYIHITDLERFRPFLAGVAIVRAARALYPDQFVLPETVYEFNTSHPAFDLLTGSETIRKMILTGETLEAIREYWKGDEERFSAIKGDFHLYE